MIDIDGLEGGGQLLRTALSLSSLTGIPFRIYNIRKKRKPSGLSYQHLITARSVRKVCRGSLKGDELRSYTLEFFPSKIVPGKYSLVIPTAGSSILLAQTLIPILINQNKKSILEIEGGTHVDNAPSYDYFSQVFLKALSLMRINVKSTLLKPGFYPEGKGKIRVEIYPSSFSFPSFFPREENIEAIIRVSSLPFHIALREKKIFLQNNIENVKIIEHKEGKGNAVFARKGFVGSSVIGKIGIRAETLAMKCIDKIKSCNYSIDSNLADQLMIYASLYSVKHKKEISYKAEITSHIKSNAYVIEKFLPIKIKISNSSLSFIPL